MNQQPTSNPGSSEFLDALLGRLRNGLAGHLDIELAAASKGAVTMQLTIEPHHMAANGFLHAGAVVTLADTACGVGCMTNLPTDAHSFTTVELKSNFLRTATNGSIRAAATLVHGGRRTQVWDASVTDSQGQLLALFRCTQMLLYP